MTTTIEDTRQEDGGEFYKETIKEACHQCGVVQKMKIYGQRFKSAPTAHYPKGECPVCGNDHSANPPW